MVNNSFPYVPLEAQTKYPRNRQLKLSLTESQKATLDQIADNFSITAQEVVLTAIAYYLENSDEAQY